MDQRKLRAAGKGAVGAVKIVSGVATATGHGLLGAFLKSHHQMQAAARIGSMSFTSGRKLVSEGMRELQES